MASQAGRIANDVHAAFVQAVRIEADSISGSPGLLLYAGDMYASRQTRTLRVGSDTYAAVPAQVYLFVLGPLTSAPNGTAVLFLVKNYEESEQRCLCNAYFGMYIASTGTVRLRSGTAFRLQGSSEQIILEADLPVTLGYAPGCGQMSFTNTRLMRQPHPLPGSELPPTATLRNFDFTLDYFLRTYGAGFSREVQWDGLERLGLLAPVCRCPPALPLSAAARAREAAAAAEEEAVCPPPAAEEDVCSPESDTACSACSAAALEDCTCDIYDPFTSCSSSSPPTLSSSDGFVTSFDSIQVGRWTLGVNNGYDITMKPPNSDTVVFRLSPRGHVAATSFVATSDRALKHNICDLPQMPALIDQLRPVSFQWKSDNSVAWGFVAQEVQQAAPQLVEHNEDDRDAPARLRVLEFLPVLVRELQDLRRRCAALEASLS